MLKARVITALILLPLVLLAIFFLPTSLFSLVSGLLFLLAAWEWSGLMGFESNWVKVVYLLLVAVLMLLSLQLPLFWILLAGVMWWIGASVWMLLFPRGGWLWRMMPVRGAIGILMLVPAWSSLILLQGGFGLQGPWYLLFMLCVVWAMDTGAYFCGKYWGKRPLAAHVSPKKTMEGFYGGLLLAALVVLLFLWGSDIFSGKSWLLVLGLSFLIAIVSVIGDLVESMFKRYQAVKDSGSILPGHGGILDRIDSLTAVAPIYGLMIACLELKGIAV